MKTYSFHIISFALLLVKASYFILLTMGDSSRSILDPIWEYVLDDYDYESDRERETKTRSRRKLDRRRKPQQEEREQNEEKEAKGKSKRCSSLYVAESNWTDEKDNRWQGFDVRDDTEDMGSIWKLSGGEEPSIQNTPKRHPWRRDGSKELTSSGSDGSMWDLLTGTEDVPGQTPQTATKSCLKTKSKYTADTGSANYGNDGSSHQFLTSTRQNDIGEIYQNSTTTEAKPKKKVVFWKRSQSQEEKQPSKKYNRESPLESTTNRPTKESSRRGQRDDDNQRYNEFDPVSMFLEVAEALDPWGSEASSASQESISVEKIGKADDRSDSSYESTEESLEKVPRESQKPSAPITEIRLQYTPVVHGEQLEDSYYDVQPPSSVDMTGVVSNIKDTPSMQPLANIDESNHCPAFPYYDEDRRTVKFFDKDDHSNNTPDNSEVQSRSIPQDWTDKREYHQRSKLQRLVCCSAAKTVASVGSLRNMDPNDIRDVFPMTRMIADDQSDKASIYGKKADFKNGVMGVPSDRFLNTKGPQSLFAYDYESNEHMDVLYNEFGKPARRSLFLRKLGPPPALLSSSNADEVVIKVEASTVSETDNVIRRGGWWGSKPAPIPNTPGVDVVGKVFHIKQKACEKYGLRPQQTVLSLVRWGGNSRFLTIKPEKLVKVPDSLDPAQVACLPEMYLTAFQALHLGQSRATRYRNNALKGKSVLIVGFMSNNLGSAIIELALRAGVANVYATAKRKHWKKLIKYGVMPLSQDPVDWILRVEGTIDLVLATNGGMREDLSRIHYRALNSTGQLVVCGHRSVGNDVPVGQWEKQYSSVMCSKNKALAKLQSKSHSCDVFDQWEKDLLLCKSDLEHLLQLLEKGSISPAILDRIPLSKVPRAHTLMESKQVSGFLICEPWMKGKQRAIYM